MSQKSLKEAKEDADKGKRAVVNSWYEPIYYNSDNFIIGTGSNVFMRHLF
jgi:hypothetical protein